MSKKSQSDRLYQAVDRLASQAGEDTDELIDWLCGEHGGMFKVFQSYFSPSTNLHKAAQDAPAKATGEQP